MIVISLRKIRRVGTFGYDFLAPNPVFFFICIYLFGFALLGLLSICLVAKKLGGKQFDL